MMRPERFRFVGTPDPMTQKEAYQCEKYMKRNRESIVRVGDFLIDVPALLSPFHLDCWNCRAVHGATCCEDGQPYAVDHWQIPVIEEELPAISARLEDPRERDNWSDRGIWEPGQPPGTIRTRHGDCLFFQEIGGRYGCAIHAYAEAEGSDLFRLKPISCQLYPIDLIDTGSGILFTAVTPETSSFSRWGTDYLEHFYCASLERRKLARHLDETAFAVDGYRPAYEWNLPLLRYVLKEQANPVESMLAEQSQARKLRDGIGTTVAL